MNTHFDYLYRDASNFKKWGEIVFAGEVDEALAARLRHALHDRQRFIASQVRISDLFFDEYPINHDDHCWLNCISHCDSVRAAGCRARRNG